MAIRVPSLQKGYDEYFSGDPAFVQLPADADDATREAHADRFRVARETGDWSPLIVEGRIPTKFVMRQIPKEILWKLRDAIRPAPNRPPEIGMEIASAWFFRAALRSVAGLENGETFKIDQETTKYGEGFATAAVLRFEDEAPGLVLELGTAAYARASRVDPKS